MAANDQNALPKGNLPPAVKTARPPSEFTDSSCRMQRYVTHWFNIVGHLLIVVSHLYGANREEYRIFRDDPYMIELDGAASVRRLSVKGGGFVRYPFQLIELASIELTDNKYLI
ncbi:hypothetical protein Tco_1168835, partial [Tanacetum coccineum]